MKKTWFVIVFCLLFWGLVKAEVCVTKKLEAISMFGQPPHTVIQKEWIGKNRMAVVSATGTNIFDYNIKKMIMINHSKKTYIKADLPLDMSKIYPGEFASIVESMSESYTFSLVDIGLTKKIGDWHCRGYLLKMTVMGIEAQMKYWASTDVPFDWKQYMNMHCEMVKLQMNVGEQFVKEFKKIQGFPILFEAKMAEQQSKSIVLHIERKPAPDNIFSIPKHYVKQERLSIFDFGYRNK